MSDVNKVKARNKLLIKQKLNAKEERLARIREQQRRERKEKLYSYRSKSQ